jgi:hypothetical protein
VSHASGCCPPLPPGASQFEVPVDRFAPPGS